MSDAGDDARREALERFENTTLAIGRAYAADGPSSDLVARQAEARDELVRLLREDAGLVPLDAKAVADVVACPICYGHGVLPYPEGVPAGMPFISSSCGPWPCHYCKGAKVVSRMSVEAAGRGEAIDESKAGERGEHVATPDGGAGPHDPAPSPAPAVPSLADDPKAVGEG